MKIITIDFNYVGLRASGFDVAETLHDEHRAKRAYYNHFSEHLLPMPIRLATFDAAARPRWAIG
jgi:hypothetical protein